MKTLVCTVGGTDAPILASIPTHRPDRVVFVCSTDDVATGAKGSYVSVERANPSLPSKAQLDPGFWKERGSRPMIRTPSSTASGRCSAKPSQRAPA